MRETVGSLRGYLIFITVLSGFGLAMSVNEMQTFSPAHLLPLAVLMGLLFCVVRFRSLLRDRPGVLIGVVVTMAALSVVGDLLNEAGPKPISIGISVLIAVYLVFNIKRLAAAEAPQTDVGEVFD